MSRLTSRLKKAEEVTPQARPADWPPGHPSQWTDDQLNAVMDRHAPGARQRIVNMTDEELMRELHLLTARGRRGRQV